MYRQFKCISKLDFRWPKCKTKFFLLFKLLSNFDFFFVFLSQLVFLFSRPLYSLLKRFNFSFNLFFIYLIVQIYLPWFSDAIDGIIWLVFPISIRLLKDVFYIILYGNLASDNFFCKHIYFDLIFKIIVKSD